MRAAAIRIIPLLALLACGTHRAGRTIVIRLVTDENGNSFVPAEVHAHRGDVLRFTLGSGVHNVDFTGPGNGRAVSLPGPSAMLQRPGATLDVPVTMPPGEYHFRCDPHSPLGMVGTLHVD